MKTDFRDYFILGHINAAGIAATVFLFKHPDTANFVTWGSVLVTIMGAYHWYVFKDSKTPDAP